MRRDIPSIILASILLTACDAAGPHTSRSPDCENPVPITLSVGEHVVVDPEAGGGCVRLMPSNAEYAVAAVSASGTETPTGVSGQYTIQGEENPTSAVRAGVRRQSISPDPAAAFDARLRARERAMAIDPGYSAIRTRPGTRAAPPAPGSNRTFKVCASAACTTFVDVAATAAWVGQNGAIYLDDAVPAGGYTQTDIDSVGALFDQYLYPIDTTAFGRESDIDQNGVVLVLLTDQVNQLSTTCGLFITGYFFGLDLLDDPNSNRGEVFYGMVPNTSGTGCTVPRSFARRTLAPTFIHEFQHMISYNRHRLLGGGEAENTWLNEGLSLFAEELGGRQVPGAWCVGGQASSCLTQFIKGDLERSYSYLASTEDAFLVEPGNSGGSLAERGANWLFVRWLADRSTTDSTLGTDITRRLTGAGNPGGINSVGESNVTAAARSTFDPTADFGTLVGQWQLANYLENVPAFSDNETTGRLRYKSWNLPAAYAGLVLGPYPLTPQSVTSLPFSLSGVLRAGSGTHLRFLPGATAAPLDVSLSTTNATSVKPRVAVVRVN